MKQRYQRAVGPLFIAMTIGMAVMLSVTTASAAGPLFKLEVAAGEHARLDTPVRTLVHLPSNLADAAIVDLKDSHGRVIIGQLTKRSLVLSAEMKNPVGTVSRELHFVLPQLAPGESTILTATISKDTLSAADTFGWQATNGDHTELHFGTRPVMRYMHPVLDESSPATREVTYKVYHHLFDPRGGRLVTKGPGGLYTHHRGMFYGFNRITYADGRKADVWHCHGDAFQSHEGFLQSEAGPILGRHTIAIDWHGEGKEVFAKEIRQMTVFNVPGGQLVEFASKLTSAGPTIKLDGDPQHAGFQFRAANEVAESTKEQTYYVRPDGRGKKGETRNWPDFGDHVNLPWNAMSFVLGQMRYTAAYLDKPTNPKEARYSERPYGRFGSYFEYELSGDKSLQLNYRIWLQEGEMTVEQVAAKSADFVTPVQVTIESAQ